MVHWHLICIVVGVLKQNFVRTEEKNMRAGIVGVTRYYNCEILLTCSALVTIKFKRSRGNSYVGGLL